MVNTVGSYENKKWQKKWIPIKRALKLSNFQRSFIIGSLLGDGTMRIGERAVHANFKVEHGLEQKELVFWKYEILKPFVFTEPKISFRYRENGERYEKSWWFRTIRHPDLTKIYRVFYKGDGYRCGHKTVPKNIETLLDPFTLAVWIMDDGSFSRRKIDISTYSFEFSEIKLLQQAMKNRFDINMQFYKDRNKGFRMYCSVQETEKFIALISQYVIPSMAYKINFRSPVTTSPNCKRRELSVTR